MTGVHISHCISEAAKKGHQSMLPPCCINSRSKRCYSWLTYSLRHDFRILASLSAGEGQGSSLIHALNIIHSQHAQKRAEPNRKNKDSFSQDFPGGSVDKEAACNARDLSSIRVSGRSKEMATFSSILAWRIPWTEESGRLQSVGLQRVGHD